MSLKLKITLGVAVGLMLILFISFTFAYYMFIRVTTNGEADLLKEKARTLLLKDLPNHPEYWQDNSSMEELLIPQEMLRYIGPDSKVIYQIYSDETLIRYPVTYVNKDTVTVETASDGIYVFVKMPVFKEGHQLATLEIGRSLRRLGQYADMLISVLLLTSTGTLILALIGGYFYTNVLFRPLQDFVSTMQNIEQSGSFRHINLPAKDTNDELVILGATFNRMIDRLQDMFQKQEQFLADASHELRTPLTIIESYASLLRRWAFHDEKLREEALEAIISESAQLKQLTQNLLSLTDVVRENCEQNVDFDLLPLARQTAASLRMTSGREIDVELASEQQELLMSGDSYKIKQLLIILLDNALKYSQQKIIMHIELTEDHWVILKVIDQGIGIAEGDIPNLFDRFYRSDKARNRKQGGVGLGLAIALHIVQKHKGTIEIQSRLGEGTTVIVKLPTTCQ
ncbi:HAMP domain-containing sensor histidine kinase [Paenibacillus chondroitinus]|uniref:histidine kinase n=1 Tax=Paenibacillus chondroitinus TaxID=59842 RepID=A0ABU6D7E7_9BACL|nr:MULTISPECIES: HAMP domain-containing sensor histidine kinase [Paenibacillus]MCY9661958.1 HAMP domain-containing histidine kinase [Paenibacillus anseongense]MEB4793644.1 HAMP domain-containing sensor histidine kinase [Paenibacillus chondroitinus]